MDVRDELEESGKGPEQTLRSQLLRWKHYLATHPKMKVAIYAIPALVILLADFVPHGWHKYQLAMETVPYAAIVLIACIEGFDRQSELWEAWSVYPLNERGENWKKWFGVLRAASRSALFVRTVALIFLIAVVTVIERFVVECFVAGGTLGSLSQAFLAGLCPPVVCSAWFWLFYAILGKRSGRVSSSKNWVHRLGIKSFFANRLPYGGAFAGYLVFLLFACFADHGVGPSVASWLQASASDAHIGFGEITPRWFTGCTSLVIAAALYNATSGLAMRLCSSFQILLNRLLVNRDTLLDALIETTGARSMVMELPDTNRGVNNILSVLGWLTFCYCALFLLVAACPGSLGVAITGWLQACLRDADLSVKLQGNENMRMFLGSICAAYGAVPVAVMSCAFLPQRKVRALIVSSQGILCPPGLEALACFSPLKLWSDLRSITLSGKGHSEKLTLTFGWYRNKVKLKVGDLDKAHLNELLATADEYASRCRFDAGTIALRSRLVEQLKENPTIAADKFTATIFSPRKGGEFLSDGRYRIVRKLSGKALSAVYLARDINNKHVVIKEFVLPTSARQRDRMLANFEREFNTLTRLDHPAIAKVIDLFEDGEARYIAIEFVEGSDLRSIVERKGARSEAVVREWAADIARTMQFLHRQETPILHRDLTPDNLMENLDGEIMLIDFGAAHQFMEGVTGTLIGKQCYIAPEQLRGKPSMRSDIYSFGGTLYYLLTGRDPAALTQCDLSGNKSVSPQMAAMIAKCTTFEEASRYKSFDEVIAAMDGREPAPVTDFLESLADAVGSRTGESCDESEREYCQSTSPVETPATVITLRKTEVVECAAENAPDGEVIKTSIGEHAP